MNDSRSDDIGLGDRHQQIVDGVTTNYTLDLAAGLTQVLSDGANTYLYGSDRIAQQALTTEYFLTDALGSVRQLADSTGVVTLTQRYAPYGETVSSAGGGYSRFQFTGEAVDANGLTYLRARYYDPSDGRFVSRDIWNGAYERPLSLNRWNYVEGNPVNYVDPNGFYLCRSTKFCTHPTGKGGENSGVVAKSFQMIPVFDDVDLDYYNKEANEGYTGFYGSGDSGAADPTAILALLRDFLVGCRPAYLKKNIQHSQHVRLNYSIHYQGVPRVDATRTIVLDELRIRNSSEIFVNYSVVVVSDMVSQQSIQASFSAAPGKTVQAPFPAGVLTAYNRFSVSIHANNRCFGDCLLPDPLPLLYAGFLNFDFRYE